jgi:Flp pilus assembly protein TadD
MLGKASLDARNVAEAATAYRRATELAPGVSANWVGLGHSLALSNDVAGAMAAYAVALERDPNLESVHYNMGVLLRRRGDAAGAAARFREALRIRPDYEAARRALAALESPGPGNGEAPPPGLNENRGVE